MCVSAENPLLHYEAHYSGWAAGFPVRLTGRNGRTFPEAGNPCQGKW